MEQSGRYKEQRDAARRELDAAEAELGDKRAELERYLSNIKRRTPDLDNAARADAYAKLIGDLLEEAVPHEVDAVATEMTSVWKAMAHLPDRVERIAISPDCKVSMLASDGTDLHEIEKSAGASQIFTLALITAITRVSGRTFPSVVDTPLARLSRDPPDRLARDVHEPPRSGDSCSRPTRKSSTTSSTRFATGSPSATS